MSSIPISLIVVAFSFGGALLGMLLRKVLPQHHLSEGSKDVVKMGVATMSAPVLGLLISSAKGSYDAQSSELKAVSSNIILLDRPLAHYGPEAREARELLRTSVAGVLDRMGSKKSTNPTRLGIPIREVDSLFDKIQELSPKEDRQRAVQSQAMSMRISLQQTRWLMYEQESTSISTPMLVILVAWLTTLFISFGLFPPANGTTITSLFVSALSVSGPILLILEMYTPYEGLIKISDAPLSSPAADSTVRGRPCPKTVSDPRIS